MEKLDEVFAQLGLRRNSVVHTIQTVVEPIDLRHQSLRQLHSMKQPVEARDGLSNRTLVALNQPPGSHLLSILMLPIDQLKLASRYPR
jgi:hypothetical protein